MIDLTGGEEERESDNMCTGALRPFSCTDTLVRSPANGSSRDGLQSLAYRNENENENGDEDTQSSVDFSCGNSRASTPLDPTLLLTRKALRKSVRPEYRFRFTHTYIVLGRLFVVNLADFPVC